MVDFVLIRENAGQRKVEFSHILNSEYFINLLQYLSVIISLKNQYLQIYTSSHYCKYRVADTENNEFLLKLFL